MNFFLSKNVEKIVFPVQVALKNYEVKDYTSDIGKCINCLNLRNSSKFDINIDHVT